MKEPDGYTDCFISVEKNGANHPLKFMRTINKLSLSEEKSRSAGKRQEGHRSSHFDPGPEQQKFPDAQELKSRERVWINSLRRDFERSNFGWRLTQSAEAAAAIFDMAQTKARQQRDLM